MSAEADDPLTVDGGDAVDVQHKGKGRNRFCKQCRFTCTDSKEFLHHQMTAHGENEEKVKTENGSSVQRRNSIKSNIPIKTRSSTSNSEHSMDTNEHSTMMSEQLINDYVNGDSSFSDEMLNDEEQDESGRLVIAEEGETTIVTPTRCGNIQNRTYVCGVCEFTSTSAKTFLHHQKDDHKHDFIIYECDICEYATKYKQKLPRHRKLHFSGQDGQLLPIGRDQDDLSFTPNSSLTEKELHDMQNIVVEEDAEEDAEEDEDEEEEIVTVEPEAPEETAAAAAVAAPSEKKKKTRQEVDPAKYFEVVDDSGIKFACSCCGNIYKWRKSLNKHWKEKHNSEIPDNSKRPPGLMYLVNSGNHTIYGRRRIYSNSILSNTGMNGHAPSMSTHSPSQSVSDTLLNSCMNRNDSPGLQAQHDDNGDSSQTLVIPNYIGPFITNTSHPVYPTACSKQDRSSNPSVVSEKEAQNYSSSAVNAQSEPLDFSVKKEESETLDPDFFKVKMEPIWDGEEERSKQSSPVVCRPKPAVLQCTKCGFMAKTLVDYSSHMTLHLNKRAFKCAECQEHFNGVDELNKHFMDCHSRKIQEHKDAIQKIPHGLQQTYHLLKMPLSSITGMNAQELTSNDAKQLKCNMCDFIAKWPAELQKHAVSHSEERPFMCMVCGSTYKWKWDLVKHFEKSHHSLPNPYKRRDTVANGKSSASAANDEHANQTVSKTAAALIDIPALLPGSWADEPQKKRRRLSDSDMPDLESRRMTQQRLSPDDIPSLIRADQRFSEFVSDRPSSVPNRVNMVEMKHEGDENDDLSQIKITNVHSLDDGDIVFRHDKYFETKRPITQETQKAVAAAVRQRLNNQSIKQSDESLFQINLAGSNTDILLPYKCPRCEYRARWPSEITQHMKNHSDEKPYHCPQCNYKSKWKWDVVKHMKRCGGGTIKDVIDITKVKKIAPPNVTVLPEGNLQQQTPQPVAYILNSNVSSAVLVPVMSNSEQSTAPSMNYMPTMQQHNPHLQQRKTLPPPPPLVQPSKAAQQKQPVFRSLINQGLYHCLECPFVGHSPAELKRHSVLHSEDKPFSCRVCGYSSRWKCDLKKHMQSYNHYAGPSVDKNSNINMEDANLIDDDHEEVQERSFVKCKKCAYIAYNQDMLDNHLKTHNDANSPAKFKCKQCSFQGNDLSSFLQHRVTHSQTHYMLHNGEMHKGEDVDEARLKHPRKQVKTFQCSKCNFVCIKRETMQIHEAEHESDLVYKCFYCEVSVGDKDSLLDHIMHHSEFNPDEWETFFMEDNKEVEEDDKTAMQRPSSCGSNIMDYTTSEQHLQTSQPSPAETQNFMASIGFPHLNLPPLVHEGQPGTFTSSQNSIRNSLQSGTYSVPNSIQYMTANNAGQSFRNIQPAPTSQVQSVRRYQCEWCEATFAHVCTIYQHAQNVHPIELHKQELGQRLKQSQAVAHSVSNASMTSPTSTPASNYSVLQSSLQNATYQPVQSIGKMPIPSYKQALQNMRKASAERPIAPAPRNPPPPYRSVAGVVSERVVKAKKTTSPQKKSRSFQCTKCPFTAPNAVTYLRHIERHGSNCKHTCWFCDYSIDRLNLLYQHMKGTHPDQWKGSGTTSENPISKEKITSYVEEITKPDVLAPTENSLQENDNKKDVNGDQKPVLIMKEQTTWRGVPIEICSIDGKKNYKCPKCHYISSNASDTSNHVRQHGSNRKYQCKSCNYSVDSLKLIYHHMQTVHPRQQAFIEVNKNVEVAPVDLEMDEHASEDSSDKKEELGTLLNCPRCPFRIRSRDIFQRHLEMHSYNGKYRCEHCSYSVDRIPLLTQHAKVHDNQKGIAKCLLEKEHFTSLLNLKSVDRNAINNKVQTASCVASKMLTMQAKQVLSRSKLNGRIRYKCSRCPYNTFCKNNLIKHRRQHVVQSRFSCHKCSYSAVREYLLHQHARFHEDELAGVNHLSIKSFQDVIMDPFDPVSKIETPQSGDKSNMEVKADVQEEMEDQGEVTDVEGEFSEIGDAEKTEEMDVETNEKSNDDHLANEKQLRNYKCKECPFSSNSSFEFSKHLKLHGAMYRYKCDYCSYSLERLNLLTQHRKLHSDEKGFDYDPSPSVLLNKEAINLENSLNETMPEIQEKVSSSISSCISADNDLEDGMRYLCKSCPYRSNSVKSFNVHTHMHGLNRKYICDHCDWSVDRLNLLYQHRKVHAIEDRFVPNFDEINFLNREYALEAPKKFKAQIQDFEKEPQKEELSVQISAEQPLHAENLSIDMRSVKKIYSCKLCPFRTNNKNSFAYHKVLHRMNARYTCSQCSYSVDRFNLLNQHMRLHDEENESASKTEQVKCPKCPYHSPSVQQLNAHIAMHASGKQYTCTYCDFSSDQYSVLQQHANIHEERRNSESPPMNDTKYKTFERDGIEKVTPQLYFNSPDDPEDSTGSDNSVETELKCERCPFSTPSKKKLEDHDFQHGIRDRLLCPYCDLSCSRDHDLLEHVQVHFPGSPVDMNTLRQMMAQRKKENNNNISHEKTPRAMFKSKMVIQLKLEPTEESTPDSTVREIQKQIIDGKNESVEMKKQCTKVYVCQYCEREFESKDGMLQHERLHLIGH